MARQFQEPSVAYEAFRLLLRDPSATKWLPVVDCAADLAGRIRLQARELTELRRWFAPGLRRSEPPAVIERLFSRVAALTFDPKATLLPFVLWALLPDVEWEGWAGDVRKVCPLFRVDVLTSNLLRNPPRSSALETALLR